MLPALCRPERERAVDLNGSHTFKAPRQTVYDVMHSREVLMHCLPGCEGMEDTGPDAYRATLKVGVAGIKGTYVCTIVGTNNNPPESWTLTVEGTSKSGNLRGVGDFRLEDAADGGTTLHYAGKADLMGPLAGVGQRVMAPAARMIIGKFFDCITSQMTTPAAATSQA